ncbi:M23 family metallopeptidase [Prescottella defluvii]|uniref:M23 family metallopeptidase n=1 Tax=Prescottella defluvii TaxID=1323361 RepID=UPI00068C0300|nr:M23 family metallopeptidase [Prescottella defluvii]
MGSAKLRLGFRRLVAGALAGAGLTTALVIGSASTAAAQPALPPLPGSADIAQFLNDAAGAINDAAGAINNVAGALQSFDLGSSSGLPFGSLGSLGGVAKPASGPITTRFGGGHMGIDIAANMGAPIYAVADGTVINAGPASGFGLWVRIRHNDGTVTTYGHNDVNFVSVGQRVFTGQRIANVGNRGNSTGPHLHFEVDLPGGIKTDPITWLATRGVLMF